MNCMRDEMEQKALIYITGANGQLGLEFQNSVAHFQEFEFKFYSSQDWDISNINTYPILKKDNKPQFIINCAAYTAVDFAENNAPQAYKVNEFGVNLLGSFCKENEIYLIHISTDFVFDGRSSIPYKEYDQTHPLSIYGKSKLQGEIALANLNINASIIRTSWLYGKYGKNFLQVMVKLSTIKNEISVIDEQISTPTNSYDLVSFILENLEKMQKIPDLNIYHFSNEGVASWYDFSVAIFKILKFNNSIIPIPAKDYPTIAIRPSYSVLSKEKIRHTFDYKGIHWMSSLENLIFKDSSTNS